jgi:hypothetical protein
MMTVLKERRERKRERERGKMNVPASENSTNKDMKPSQ